MSLTLTTETSGRRLFIPALRGLYSNLHESAETIVRVVAGLALIAHGTSKIADPFGAAEMVQSLGFYPGAFWSLILSCTEFFGGILLAIGLFTRPAALAATVVLVVAAWYHWVTLGQGYLMAEKAIIWAAVCLFFAIRGGNRHSVDARIGREF